MSETGDRTKTIKTFRDLKVWQHGHQVLLDTYRITKQFPDDEKFVLVSQMRRAALSVTSNLAEGFGRHSDKDREHFYVMAYGSLVELENQLQAAFDLGYIDKEDFVRILDKIQQEGRMLNSLLLAHKRRN